MSLLKKAYVTLAVCGLCVCAGLPAAHADNAPQPGGEGGADASMDGGYYIGVGWKYYNSKDYEQAAKFFTFALQDPESTDEAKLGLGFCYQELKKADKAIGLFMELVDKGYKTQDILPALIPLLVQSGDEKTARKLLGGLDGEAREEWERLLDDNLVRKNFLEAQARGDLRALETLIETHRDELAACKAPELFYDSAAIFAIRGKRREALGIYNSLIEACPELWDFRPAFFYGVKDMTPVQDMIPVIERELRRPSLPPEYRREMERFIADIYKGVIDTLDPSSPRVKKYAERILETQPGDYFTKTVLARWYYHNGQYGISRKMFHELNQRFKEEKGDKLEGLIYSLIGLGRIDEAIRTFEDADIKHGEAQKKILNQMLALVDSASPYSKVLAKKVLQLDPDNTGAKSRLGWWNYHSGEYREAYRIFNDLYKKSPGSNSAKSLLLAMLKLELYDQALILYDEAEIDDPELKLGIMKSRFFELPPNSPERDILIGKILEADPEDRAVLSVLGWKRYNQGEYEASRKIFDGLYQKEPQNSGYASGLLNSLVKLGDIETALDVTKKMKLDEGDAASVRGGLYFNIGAAAFDDDDYARAEEYLRKALSLDPERQGSRSLLMWTLYKRGKTQDALEIALAGFEENRDPDTAKDILLFYGKLDRHEDAARFIESLLLLEGSAFRKTVADYYFSRKWDVRAAQTHEDPETPYYNAHTPWLDASYYQREKTGTVGRSRLSERAYPVTLNYPLSSGRSFSFQLRPTYLDAGSAATLSGVGRDYLGDSVFDAPITKVHGIFPEFTYDVERDVRYTFKLGATMFGGPVDPAPTFLVKAKGRNWTFAVHQKQKDNTILSYVGQKDPYSGDRWGRILVTGAEAGVSFSPHPSYWISLKGGYDIHWGHNVWRNDSAHAASALGKSFEVENFDVSLGYILSGRTFDHNTNFATFGHGGYFSPDIFYIHGPFISVSTQKNKPYWLKASFSYGFYKFKADPVPAYPLNLDAPGTHSGDEKADEGISANVEGFFLLSPNVALGGFYSTNNTTDYREIEFGVSLRVYASARSSFIPWEKRTWRRED